MGRLSTTVASGAALLVLASPARARAGNTEHPRTPVLWPDAPCIQTVDRSAEPEFGFAYTIPFEDTILSVDEFEDSRTHQFIGFCRQWPPGRPPPRYISVYDLERAIVAGFEDDVEADDPEATLETSELWSGCWTRITADDQRRPITEEAAAAPVIWDTSTIDAGTWLIAGYTWEPPYNLWARAPWVVRVVDEPEPAEPVQAAAALADAADSLYADESLELELCVDAAPGSSVALDWTSTKIEPLAWETLSSAPIPAGSQELSLAFAPPEPSWGKTVLLRARVEQPEGPSYAAHALSTVIVFKPPDDPGEGDGDGDGGGDPGETGGDETGETDGGDETGESGVADDGSARCSLDPGRGTLPTLVFSIAVGLGLVSTRRRPRPTREKH